MHQVAGASPVNRGSFADSVLPVVDAGQADVVDSDHVVALEPDGRICLEPAPGHTPGNVTIAVRGGGREALLCGDVIHHPIQLVLPWLVANPSAFVSDTVVTLLEFHPIRFANTWYLYFLNEHGTSLPFAVTGLAMALAVAASVWAVWRRQPGAEEVLRWMALVLAVANLVNKQAFYNQFWLVAALVVASLAVEPLRARSRGPAGGEVSVPARPAAAASPG